MNDSATSSDSLPSEIAPTAVSRREFIRRLGKAVVVAPVVANVSLDIPKAMAY